MPGRHEAPLCRGQGRKDCGDVDHIDPEKHVRPPLVIQRHWITPTLGENYGYWLSGTPGINHACRDGVCWKTEVRADESDGMIVFVPRTPVAAVEAIAERMIE